MQLEMGPCSPPRSPARGRTGRIGERAQKRRTTLELMRQLQHDAQQLCAMFGLEYRSLEAERANVKSRYGVCFSDGTIKIRLFHATTGKPLKYSSLIDTLCHELAHLRHFNHGWRFQELYQRILRYARRKEIYRPGRSGAERPRRAARSPEPRRGQPVRTDQLSLFG